MRLCMASAAKHGGPRYVRPLRASNVPSQLVVAESIEELNPLVAHLPQLIEKFLKALTTTGLDLALILTVHERGAFLRRISSAREPDGVGVTCHQPLANRQVT